MSGTRELVFVYGTLRKGGTNHFRMSGADFVAEGIIKGRIYRISWYPGLVLGDEGEVKGELYSIDAAQLLELDGFEGLSPGEMNGDEYRRVKTVVFLGAGKTVSAWVWEWTGSFDERDLLEQGDWIVSEPGDE